MTFKEILKIITLGDTKRPPKLGYEKFTTNSKESSFTYEYGSYKHSYGNKHYWIRFQLSKDDFSTSIYWTNVSFDWNILICSKDDHLTYEGRYYQLKYEVKNLIHFVCCLAKHEYRKQRRENKLALASKEVRLFRELNKKIKEMESDFYPMATDDPGEIFDEAILKKVDDAKNN